MTTASSIALTRSWPASPRGKSCGLTLVEVVVIMGAIGLLVVMLLPAVMASREHARRSQCLANLHQLGQACGAHESARKCFPYTAISYIDENRKMHAPISPHASLLPYLEVDNLYSAIAFNDIPFDLPFSPPNSKANQSALAATVGIFACPSDGATRTGTNYRASIGTGPGVFPTPGGACSDPGDLSGAFVNGRATSTAEFVDGLSSTVFFSERPVGLGGRPAGIHRDSLVVVPDICTATAARQACATANPGLTPHDTFLGATWLIGGWRHTWYNHITTPNAAIFDCAAGAMSADGGRGAYAARSFHPGGVNVCMGDGAAKFVSDEVDAAVWQAFATRRGSDAVE
jgi:prepilin-type processing-associated H-X9-DG protein